jgi:ABC-type transporter Mla maintaining outer membrane lipid asymmetry ATPase subunit MlaF
VTVVECTDVSKDFHGLRPLRIQQLTVEAGEHVAILGLDGQMAEVFVNLVTGAIVPDRGEVKVFGRLTTAIEDSTDWLATIDRFGIVSERAVLLDGLSTIQNLAMPFTLELEPPPDRIRAQAIELAREVGLGEGAWAHPVAELEPLDRARVRLGRALALGPGVLLLEHASAGLPLAAAASLASEIRTVAARRGAAVIAATADAQFAAAVAARVLVLEPGTGRLKEQNRSWRFLSSWFQGSDVRGS